MQRPSATAPCGVGNGTPSPDGPSLSDFPVLLVCYRVFMRCNEHVRKLKTERNKYRGICKYKYGITYLISKGNP
ncbi:hypothetical protein HanHA300_Chr16g0597701 [Helianthus annuus]|nr:hypothetical protein HanHA300_Chr16g0597701 [Helianthus annuus]KAJ0459367.1 hypothetical protein HanHA89_Chr16g0648171 [Helianthus annuus]